MTTLTTRAMAASLSLVLLSVAAPAQCPLEGERVTTPIVPPGDLSYGSWLGVALDGTGSIAAFGAPEDATNGTTSGAVHVWRHDGTTWHAEPRIAPATLLAWDRFGYAIALDADGDTLLAGAPGTLPGTEGRAYVLRDGGGGTWSVEAELASTDTPPHGSFGARVDLDGSGTVAVVSCHGGGAHVFRRTAGTWVEEVLLPDPVTRPVAISGDGGTIALHGTVWRHDGSQWVQDGALIDPDGLEMEAAELDALGATLVARPVVFSPNQRPRVFRRDASGWHHEQTFENAPELLHNGLSITLAASGETVVARGTQSSGGGWVVAPFRFDGASWVRGSTMTATMDEENLGGGLATSADGSVVVVGARSTASTPVDEHAFYSFRCASVQTFCEGVGCPCGNDGLPGRGCDNAAGTGGVQLSLELFGPDNAGGGSASLVTNGYPPGAEPTTVLLRSAQHGRVGAPLFDGLMCLQGPVTRMRSAFASGGSAAFEIAHGAGAGAFHYQAWYRNGSPTYCTPAQANLSSGLTLIWR